MPKVSVIIPTYNCAHYLSDAIDSVVNQDYHDFEIVIVDDGSTDNTKEIVERYIQSYDNKIRYFYQENKGIGASRNRAIKESKGDYIVFLDADDILFKDSLIRREQLLNEFPDISLVFSDYHLMNGDLNTIKCPHLFKKGFVKFFKDTILVEKEDEIIFNQEFYYKYFEFSQRPIWIGTVMIRKSIIDDIGLFRTDISVGDDNDYWFRVIKKYRVGFINQSLSCYRNIFSMLTKRTEKYNLDSIKIFTEIYSSNIEARIKRLVKKKLASACYELGYYYNKRCLQNKARKYLLMSVFYNPKNKDTYKSLLCTLIPYGINKVIKKYYE